MSASFNARSNAHCILAVPPRARFPPLKASNRRCATPERSQIATVMKWGHSSRNVPTCLVRLAARARGPDGVFTSGITLLPKR